MILNSIKIDFHQFPCYPKSGILIGLILVSPSFLEFIGNTLKSPIFFSEFDLSISNMSIDKSRSKDFTFGRQKVMLNETNYIHLKSLNTNT